MARSERWKKLLCFCNMRESVETVAADFAPLWHPYPVVAHHGSLSRQERLDAEALMKEAGVAICVATSTLEVGIDIGDIDAIILAEPPWSISALLQRIGRGNRRVGFTRVIALASTQQEKRLLEAMFQTAASGALPAEPYQPDLSVVVQQTFSYLFQHPEGVPETELLSLLECLCDEDDARHIVRYLRQETWLEWHAGRWYASAKVMNLGERGRIHSNIPDGQAYRVIDVDSDREVGMIAGVFDEVFVLARRTWRVVVVGNGVVKVRRFSGRALAPLFRRHRHVGAFHALLPPNFRSEVKV